MKKMRELKGMPILSLQEGERLGQVRDLIVDPATAQVVALVLDRRTPKGELLIVATANIRNVGRAAITVESRGSMVPLSRIPRFQELVRAKRPVHGKPVISELGTRLGHVDDLEVDEENFRIVSFVLRRFLRRGQVIRSEQVRTIGPDAVVVREEALEIRPTPAPRPAPSVPFPSPPPEAPPPVPFPTPAVADPPAPPPAEPTPVPPLPEAPPPRVEEKAIGEVEPAIPPISMPEVTTPQPPAEAAPPPGEPPISSGSPEPAAPPPEAAREEGENAWQRWVRRLRHREEEEEE